MIIFWFLVTTYSAAAFEFKCPHSSQRRFRAIGVCQDESKYSCLLDIINEVYIEICNQTADYVVRGEKYVISGGRRSYPCSSDRYQPFKFWINVQSKCYYQKSLCTENEQILYNNSSTIDDNMCQCNFNSGYGFVTTPRNQCYCMPFQEDCTCYRIPCPANTTLAVDDTCRINNKCKGEFETVIRRMNMFSPNMTQNSVADQLMVQSKPEAIMLVLTIITLVLVAVIIALFKTDFKEDSNIEEICLKELDEETPVQTTYNSDHDEHDTFDIELFKKQLIYNWSSLINEMEPRKIIHLLGSENINIKEDKKRHENNRLILIFFLDNTCSKKAEQFKDILENQSSVIKEKLQRELPTLKWSKRDAKKCMSLLSKIDILNKEIELNDLVVLLLEKSVLSVKDYKSANSTKKPINEIIYATLYKGSFECVLEFLKKTQPGLYEEINSGLPKAISAELDVATMSGNLQTVTWRDKTVRFVLQITNRGKSIVFPERTVYCSKWFIQEFALYPDPKTLNFLPLTEDVYYRVKKSVLSGGLINVMEIYLCGEDVIDKLQHPLEEIEVCFMVDCLGKNNSFKDTSLENPLLDYSHIFSLLEDVVLKEMQPRVVKKQFFDRGIELSTNMNPNREQNDISKELLEEIKTSGRSKTLVEIWKKEESYAYERLNSFISTFVKDISLENQLLDYSQLLSLLEDVVLTEIQPKVVKKQFLERGINLSTDMNPNRGRNDIATDLITEIKKRKDLSKTLVEIWKNDESYAYKRLNSFISTFFKYSYVLGNIMNNMVKIVEIGIDLDDLISYFVKRKVFDDNLDDVRSRPCEQAITELMFMIVQKGTMAIGFFIDALYFYNNDELADILLLTTVEQHIEFSSTSTAVMNERENSDILLKAKIQVNIS